jgi:hypothetical protein
LPTSHGRQYSKFFFQTDIALSEPTCKGNTLDRGAADMLDGHHVDAGRLHGARILLAQPLETIRPGRVILNDRDHPGEVRTARRRRPCPAVAAIATCKVLLTEILKHIEAQ